MEEEEKLLIRKTDLVMLLEIYLIALEDSNSRTYNHIISKDDCYKSIGALINKYDIEIYHRGR